MIDGVIYLVLGDEARGMGCDQDGLADSLRPLPSCAEVDSCHAFLDSM